MTAEPAVHSKTSFTRPTLLPATSYYAAAVLELERAAIFACEWTFVGDMNQLESIGDYVAATVAGYPIFVINDAGELRAFHNVCRHRGGPLLLEGGGNSKSLICRYHGWRYGLDGVLQSARDFDPDAGDCAGELSLGPVQVAAWRGLVFASLDTHAASLRDWLGGMIGECARYPLESFRPAHCSTHHIAANWKVYAENYQEGYHIPIVHPGLNKQIDAREYQVEVKDRYCVHHAPARDGSVTSGVWLWRFPGLALNVYANGMCVEIFTPEGPIGTRVDYAFYFAEGTPASEVDAAVASSTTILDEDRVICEAVQRNMSSGLYSGGFLSPRHEGGVAYVQQLVLAALGSATGGVAKLSP